MRKLMAIKCTQTVLTLSLILSLVIMGDINMAIGQDIQTLEGEWAPTSPDAWYYSITIVRQNDGYYVTPKLKPNVVSQIWGGLYQGNATQIIASRNVPSTNFANDFPSPVIRALSGKIIYKYRFTLSSDGHSAEFAYDRLRVYYYQNTGKLVDYKIEPFYDKKTLKRISGPTKVENRSDRAYQADCGPVDPNRTTPFPPDHEFCPGNLVCMTNFCGGGMGCPYVCCPKGLPYLNHCDCKCYATSKFDCHSYSYCREKLLR